MREDSIADTQVEVVSSASRGDECCRESHATLNADVASFRSAVVAGVGTRTKNVVTTQSRRHPSVKVIDEPGRCDLIIEPRHLFRVPVDPELDLVPQCVAFTAIFV
jgi:hypothetical protein